MFGYGKKQQQQSKKALNETSLLYYKVGKEGVVTNYQAWLRGWREHKITEFDIIFQEGLREKEFDLEAELQSLEYQPMVTILKEFSIPTREGLRELEAETNDVRRSYKERRTMAEWADEQAKINATIKATNDTIKKQRNEIIARGNETTHKNTITKLMGQVMADTTSESR
jgi:predicted  nucleic acid-binding Zn-ribbon protein